MVLTLSILLFASALGLTPNIDKKQLEARQAFSQTLAFQALVGYSRNDQTLVRQVLDNAVSSSNDLLAAAVRDSTGTFFYHTPQHQAIWPTDLDNKPSTRFVKVPLMANGQQLGHLELAYKSLNKSDASYFNLPRRWLLAIFLALSAFVSYRLFIGRALRYLDPSSVVPARVRNALNVLAEGVFILDRRENIVLANTILSEQLGINEKALVGRKASSLDWQLEDPNTPLPWSSALDSSDKIKGVRLALLDKNHQRRVFRVNAVPIFDNTGSNQGVIASFDDISELEEKNRQLQTMLAELAQTQKTIQDKNRTLEYMAAHDPLTGCFNRRAMRSKLEQAFDDASIKRTPLCCIMLDIDHFKRVNDTYGHTVGDDIIKLVAEVLNNEVREGDFVARFGGEEFCMILPDTDTHQALTIANRCRENIAQRECSGVRVTASFGVSSMQLGAEAPTDLVKYADEALYYSKEHGRNKVTCWDSAMASVTHNP
jgi:diguanylate cyclase (GGDEF)-like protein/PAS domain S-box-containing protein